MALAARRRSAPAVIQSIHLPAPIGGLNAVDALGAMPLRDCGTLVNMLPAEYGLRSRLGHREWAIGLSGASDDLVRSILPFHGSMASKDRLFACTSSGIWNVTSTGSTTTVYAAATAYAIDDFVTANSTTFGCKTAGTSHASAGLPSVWAPTTVYALNARVINNNNVYICTTGGTSAGSGGPSGTSTGITDGTVVWDYQSADTAISDGTATWTHQPNNTAPTAVLNFGTTTSDAGYGIFTTMINAAGDHFGIYCDEVNGYQLYTESTDSWAAGSLTVKAGSVGSFTVDQLVFPIVFKNRLWFVQRDTPTAWYTDTVNAISGDCVPFRFGHKFRAGGYLVGLWSWTLDGGSGPDDYLVAVSSGGDVLVYQLTDPSTPTGILLKGAWYLGGIPKYRRIATDYGGDLLFLTKSGIVPLSRLVAGALQSETQIYQSAKIANLFNRIMVDKSSLHGWSIRMHPEDNAIVITYPTDSGQATKQFAQSQATKGWALYEDLPIYSSEVWGGKFYFGTVDGRVCVNDGYIDARILADSSAYSDITFQVIPAFTNLGNGLNKQGQEAVTYWLVDGGSVPVNAEGRYDFDPSAADAPSAASVVSGGWDAGTWDGATWGGEFTSVQHRHGLSGSGRHMSVAIKGKARSRTVLVGLDYNFTVGGAV